MGQSISYPGAKYYIILLIRFWNQYFLQSTTEKKGKKELLLAPFFNWSMAFPRGEDGVLYAKGQVPLLMFPTVAETLFAALKPGDGDQEGQAMR